MKKLFYLLLLPLLFANCKDDCNVVAEMPYTLEFNILPGLNPLLTHYFKIEDIPNITPEAFTANGITLEDVTEIKGKSARFSTIFAGPEYDFIREVSVRIYTDDPDDYSEIFYRTNVPENTRSDLDLIGSLTNVQRHLTGDTFNIIICLQLRRTTPQNIESRFDFRMAAC